MGSQSAVMMKMAGEQWQYGKRRISAMSNEEFNKMTPLKLFEIETNELKAMIPLMEKSMKDMSELTPMIVKEMVDLVKVFIETAPSYILKLLGIDVEGIISGKTPGEQEYEEWLKGGKVGPEPSTLTFPSPTPPIIIPKTEKEKSDKVLETVTTYAGTKWDTKIVGAGKNKDQLQKSIQYYETLIKSQQMKLKLIKPLDAKSIKKLKIITAYIQTLQNVRETYKAALAWSLKNFPKLTPAFL